MATSFSSALYYPHIDIRNEHWLRSAVLFWDSIRTIVPISHREPYTNDFTRSLSDEGILQPVRVSPDMDEIEDIAEKAFDFITDPASVSVIYNIDDSSKTRIHSDKIPRDLLRLARIHPEKFSDSIIGDLQRGLGDDGWLHVEPTFAKFYMTLLATQLSERLGLSLITESSAADQLAVSVRKGRPISNSPRRIGRHFDAHGPRRTLPQELTQSLLVDLMLQGISLPNNLTVQEILKFKNSHVEELAIFRREVSRLTSNIPHDLPIEALRQAVSDQYQSNVLPAMNSLKQSLKAQCWGDGLNGFLKVSCFTAAPTSAALLAGIPSTIALVAGAGVSLTATAIQSIQQRRKIKTESPYSYLLSIDSRW
ncbi:MULTISPECIES: hypothetical protein [Pectobacterium]|uniref:Uncharacterized protein n=1 Tax=Pectobacterium versatile TaxID=2488639 RepID=A0AAW3RTI3_9GAMM|nr:MULTISPECIES: hypothetical protein [Pectobacterium]MBA0159434.1 hypothetical protein [Pectobacterium versatile]MCA6924815.1 hypothetical protein [Pectobacterium versatile]MCH5081579.1 hypothetical protein [Pectobacterium versatile]PWD64333.1 hypothetical protein DF214_04875 [Pectobacterium atrosepticum]QWC51664.1 hypothetical protein HLB43_13425 [Pectobacterium atrosepticum]